MFRRGDRHRNLGDASSSTAGPLQLRPGQTPILEFAGCLPELGKHPVHGTVDRDSADSCRRGDRDRCQWCARYGTPRFPRPKHLAHLKAVQ